MNEQVYRVNPKWLEYGPALTKRAETLIKVLNDEYGFNAEGVESLVPFIEVEGLIDPNQIDLDELGDAVVIEEGVNETSRVHPNGPQFVIGRMHRWQGKAYAKAVLAALGVREDKI